MTPVSLLLFLLGQAEGVGLIIIASIIATLKHVDIKIAEGAHPESLDQGQEALASLLLRRPLR